MENLYTTKKEIENWLLKYKISQYKLIEDEKYGFIVDIQTNVELGDKKLNKIQIKFNKIGGNFDCSQNELILLKGCPEIVSGDFKCHHNKITSLEFSPSIVKHHFDCSHNQITSLEFCPTKLKGNFDCYRNNLTSLKFFPTKLKGNFYCNKNPQLGVIQDINNKKELLEVLKKVDFNDKLTDNLEEKHIKINRIKI